MTSWQTVTHMDRFMDPCFQGEVAKFDGNVVQGGYALLK